MEADLPRNRINVSVARQIWVMQLEKHITDPRQDLGGLFVDEGINLVVVFLLAPLPAVAKGRGNRRSLHWRMPGGLAAMRAWLSPCCEALSPDLPRGCQRHQVS